MSADSSLSVWVRAHAQLALEGAALGLLLPQLWLGEDLVPYARANVIEPATRSALFLAVLAGGAVLPLLVLALAALARLRESQRGTTAWLAPRIAQLLSPLLPLSFLPLLLQVPLWVPHPIALLAAIALFSLALATALSASLAAWPASGRTRIGALARSTSARLPLRAQQPLLMTLIGATVFAAFFARLALIAHFDGYTSTFDLGIFDNVVWNTTHFSSPIFKASPLRGPEGGHLGIHATFLAFALAPIYAIFPRAETLLVLQALIVGAGAVPLYYLGKNRIGAWGASLLSLAYLLYPAVQGSILYHFHFLPLSATFLLLLALALDQGRRAWVIVTTVFALSVREDIGVGVAMIGAYFLLSNRRAKAGLGVFLAGAIWTVLVKFVIMPAEGGGSSFVYMYETIYPPDDPSLRGVLKTLVANPGYLWTTLATQERFLYVLQLLVPVLFFPLRQRLNLLLLVPGFAFTLLMGRTSAGNSLAPVSLYYQYTAHWSPYVFLGVLFTLEHLRQTRGLSGDRFRAVLGAILSAVCLSSLHFGAFFQQETARAGGIALHSKTSPEELANRATRRSILAKIPPRVAVAASDCLVPHVSARKNAYFFRGDPFDAEYVVSEFGMPCTPGTNELRGLLARKDFGVVALEKPYVLLRRGAPTDQNRELRRELNRIQRGTR